MGVCCRDPDPFGPHVLRSRQLGEWPPSHGGREARGSEGTCQADSAHGAFSVLCINRRTAAHWLSHSVYVVVLRVVAPAPRIFFAIAAAS